jgi:hypothetical protein
MWNDCSIFLFGLKQTIFLETFIRITLGFWNGYNMFLQSFLSTTFKQRNTEVHVSDKERLLHAQQNILCKLSLIRLFFHGATAPSGPRPPHHWGFVITLGHTTLGRTPLDEGSARRRDLCLTRHNTHKRQISIPSPGFEPTIPASKRPQTHALDRVATGIGITKIYPLSNILSTTDKNGKKFGHWRIVIRSKAFTSTSL